MATTTNYGWTTPDDTALVKDGAAAIRSLGTAIDTSFAADEGDLLIGGTSDIFEALPIGAVGTVLTSDGDTAEWAAPAAGGANWSLLNAGGTALTGAQTVTVSGISGKDKIMVIVRNASSVNSGAQINLRLNTDTGGNYNYFGPYLDANTSYSKDSFTSLENAGQGSIIIGVMSSVATSVVNGAVVLDGCNSAGLKVFSCVGGGTPSTGNGQRLQASKGFYDSASTISSISIISTSGNLDNGNVFVYTSA